MPSPGAGAAPHESWTSEEWERRRVHAAEFLARPESERGKWVVGPDVVAYYERARDRARAREAAADAC
jgi:hypothetical protein